jgi:hypothetical protein
VVESNQPPDKFILSCLSAMLRPNAAYKLISPGWMAFNGKVYKRLKEANVVLALFVIIIRRLGKFCVESLQNRQQYLPGVIFVTGRLERRNSEMEDCYDKRQWFVTQVGSDGNWWRVSYWPSGWHGACYSEDI